MSLTKAVQFRQLLAKLTNEERIGFLSNIINSHADLLVTSLFCHLMHAQRDQMDVVNDFNDKLSNIIQERKDKQKQEHAANTKLAIDQLPSALIGFTASFLNQNDYFHFSFCNRAIYLGCNSPNGLYKLDIDLKYLKDYSSINLLSFPRVNCLAIDPNKAIRSESFTVHQLNHVTTLRLEAHETSGWIETFARNIINCNTVTRLYCRDFGSRESVIQREAFLNLLMKFPNLEQLELYYVFVDETVTAEDIAKICPNINGLYLYPNKSDLIRRFCTKLKYLSFDDKNDAVLSTASFETLEELEILAAKNETIIEIIKSASRLKKICLCTCYYWGSNDFDVNMSNAEIQHTATRIITQCPFITYMFFTVQQSDFLSLLEGIECGLFKTKKQQRSEMKIEIFIYTEDTTKSTANDTAFQVDQLLNSLETSVIDNFMVIVKFEVVKGHEFNEDFEQEIHRDLSCSSVNRKIFRLSEKHRFVITNVKCNINGHSGDVPYFYSGSLDDPKFNFV